MSDEQNKPGWLGRAHDAASLRPGDEGLVEAAMNAYSSAYIQGEHAKGMRSAVAAVLAFDRERLLADAQIGGIEREQAIMDDCRKRLIADGYSPPDEVAKLNAELREKADECATLAGRNSQLRTQVDALRTANTDAWCRDAAVPMSELALENQRLRQLIRKAARKLLRGVGDEPTGNRP